EDPILGRRRRGRFPAGWREAVHRRLPLGPALRGRLPQALYRRKCGGKAMGRDSPAARAADVGPSARRGVPRNGCRSLPLVAFGIALRRRPHRRYFRSLKAMEESNEAMLGNYRDAIDRFAIGYNKSVVL